MSKAVEHQFLLQPVSASAFLRRHLTPSPLKSRSQPRLSCHITMSSFPIHLSDQQYSQMVLANRLYNRLDKARHFIKWRPSCPIKGKAKDWWMYAIEVQRDLIRARNKNANWSFVLSRANDLCLYVNAYIEQLINPTSLPTEDRELMDRLEMVLGFTELKALREVAMLRVEERTPQQTPTHTMSPVETTQSISSKEEQSVVPELSSPTSEASSQGETLLWTWFPRWKGWYGKSDDQSTLPTSPASESYDSPLDDDSLYSSTYSTPLPSLKSDSDSATPGEQSSSSRPQSRKRHTSTSLEEELLYVITDSIENNTFTKRDAVFCQLSFALEQGKFALSTENVSKGGSKMSDLFELEFSNVKISLESRPRNKSYKFDIQLGSLYLKDQITKDPSFPYLIAPQTQIYPSGLQHLKVSRTSSVPSYQHTLRSKMLYSRSTSIKSDPDSKTTSNYETSFHDQMDPPLFSLVYEHSPLDAQSDHKLTIVSQPLDLVYHPAAVNAATAMFLQPLKSKSKYHQSIHQDPSIFSMAAKKRYDAIMEQTKIELRKNWDQIFHGGLRKQWAFNLDISAPQIIIPENFNDSHSSLVVLDLGRLTFCSANAGSFADQSTAKKESKESNKPSGWMDTMARMLGRTTDADDNDEEFATPCTTPDELSADDDNMTDGPPPEPLTEELLHSHMYDKYELNLCDMQVMVCKVKDNWRFACQRGTGPMHLIDRFSISVLVSRRMVHIMPSDRPWPTATLAATLPNIMLHLSQAKVHALLALYQSMKKRQAENVCVNHNLDDFSSPKSSAVPKSESQSSLFTFAADSKSEGKSSDKESDLSNDRNESSGKSKSFSHQKSGDASEDTSTFVEESKLLVIQVNIEKLSIELVSRGRSIAEVQVTGVKGIVQHRPFNYSASLTIHSFLLVDALQTFGPDFELLIASHKHISMDTVSGSLMDSEPCSPKSPASPDPNLSYGGRSTSPIILRRALSALATDPKKYKNPSCGGISSPQLSSPPGLGIDLTELDTEALISVEITYVTPECPSQEGSGPLLFASLQFNTVDIIANQETVVELVGFIHQLVPPVCSNVSSSSRSTLPKSFSRSGFQDSKSGEQSVYGSLAMLYSNPSGDDNETVAPLHYDEPLRVEVCFDFTKLSVLLLRAAIKNKEVVGRKVGTAVLSQVKVQTTVAHHHLSMEGSLGGFQVRDITPEPNKHQCIISVGQDVYIEKQQDIISKLNSGLYQSYAERDSESQIKAFSFSIQRPLAFTSSPIPNMPSEEENRENLTVNLKLASVLYTHSPSFLKEISSCAEEFKQYMTHLAQGIKHAATEVAMGLVRKRIESFAVLPGYAPVGSAPDSPLHRTNSLARSIDTLHLPYPPPATASHTSPTHSPPSDLVFRLKLNVILETPIVVLPESVTSSSVIVAQLGQISIQNVCLSNEKEENTTDSASAKGEQISHDLMYEAKGFEDVTKSSGGFRDNDCSSLDRTVEYDVSVCNMSLYSLDIDERKLARESAAIAPVVRCAADLYRWGNDCSSIIHSSSIKLLLSHKRSPVLIPDSHAGMLVFPDDIYSTFEVGDFSGKVTRLVDSLEISGGVVSAVKLSLSRLQYHQLMQTLSNISISRPKSSSNQKHLLDSILEEGADKRSSPVKKKKAERTSDGETKFNSGFASQSVGAEMKEPSIPEMSIQGEFTVPRVEVELVGDVNGCKQPLVNLILEEFKADYYNTEEHKTSTKVTLKSLILEDLLCPENSPHRYLLRSVEPPSQETPCQKDSSAYDSRRTFIPPPFISTSCPVNSMEYWGNETSLSKSLPTRLEIEKPYFTAQKRPMVRNSVRKRRKNFKQSGRGSSMTLPGLFNEPNSDLAQGDDRRRPHTPPSSPVAEHSPLVSPDQPSNLVKICVTSVDENDPNFMSEYNGTHRSVNVAFNSLVAVVNIPSWVMILDFFSTRVRKDSSNLPNLSSSSNIQNLNDAIDGLLDRSEPQPSDSTSDTNSELNTVVETSVVWLEIGFVRVDGSGNTGVEVAGASVRDVSVRSVGSDGNLTLTGRLGSLSVTDRTLHGHRFKHKFLTSGPEALTFQLFKYSLPDPTMLRECDMRLNIRMASVMYIHTQRFATELTHVVQQFTQLQSIVEKWRAIKAGQQVHDYTRGARVSLSVSAGSPVIFLPLCGEGSNKVLVADLGSLDISNKFLWAGSQGTISKIERERLADRLSDKRTTSRSRSRAHRSRSSSLGRSKSRATAPDNSSIFSSKPPKCLLDVMNVQLSNMDLYAAEQIEEISSFSKRKSKGKYDEHLPRSATAGIDIPGAQKEIQDCEDADENDDTFPHSTSSELKWQFPDQVFVRKGRNLLKEKCVVSVQVERNLDGDVSRRVPDISIQGVVSKVHVSIDEDIYKLIRGLLQFNLGENLDELHLKQSRLHHPHLPSHANIRNAPMSDDVYITLDIAIDLDNVIVEALLTSSEDSSHSTSLTSVNLIKSRLLFQSNSEGGKDVDLVSQEILLSDNRFDDSPANKRSNVFTSILQPTPSKTTKNESLLQAELHYRSTKEITRFTILVNNMRLFAILDWWKEVLSFIQLQSPNPYLSSNASSLAATRANTISARGSTGPTTPLSVPSPRSLSPGPTALHSKHELLQRKRRVSGLGRTSPRLNPLVESTGVMPKHLLLSQEDSDCSSSELPEPYSSTGPDASSTPFELKINITDSEIVVVEDASQHNSGALIFKVSLFYDVLATI